MVAENEEVKRLRQLRMCGKTEKMVVYAGTFVGGTQNEREKHFRSGTEEEIDRQKSVAGRLLGVVDSGMGAVWTKQTTEEAMNRIRGKRNSEKQHLGGIVDEKNKGRYSKAKEN